MSLNKSAEILKNRFKATESMIADLHPVEKSLTQSKIQEFQVQSWVINRAYIDDILCEALLNSLLQAPKNHIYQKWTTKVIECLSSYTMESPWVAISELIGLKKNDIKSHTLNLPVSRLISKSINTMVANNSWNANIALTIAFLFGMKKSSAILRMAHSQNSKIITEEVLKEFSLNHAENAAIEELILAISPELIKTEAEIANLFKTIQFITEGNWIINDGIYMESFYSMDNAKNTQNVANSSSHSLAFLRNKATADFLR